MKKDINFDKYQDGKGYLKVFFRSEPGPHMQIHESVPLTLNASIIANLSLCQL